MSSKSPCLSVAQFALRLAAVVSALGGLATTAFGVPAAPSASLIREQARPLKHEVVVSGADVEAGDPILKSTVLLRVTNANSSCTGVVIADDLILTAAHCVQLKPEHLKVEFFRSAGETAAVREVKAVLPHEGYNGLRTHFAGKAFDLVNWFGLKFLYMDRFDIALVRFAGGIPSGFETAEILPNADLLVPGMKILAVGFGKPQFDSQSDERRLRSTTFEVGEWFSKIDISAMDPQGKSSLCYGDSGAPGYVQQQGRLYVFGIVHTVENAKCVGRTIYGTLFEQRGWITEASERIRAK